MVQGDVLPPPCSGRRLVNPKPRLELLRQHSETRSPTHCRWTGLVSSRRCLSRQPIPGSSPASSPTMPATVAPANTVVLTVANRASLHRAGLTGIRRPGSPRFRKSPAGIPAAVSEGPPYGQLWVKHFSRSDGAVKSLKLTYFSTAQEVRAPNEPVPSSISRVPVTEEVEAVELLEIRRHGWHRCSACVAGKDDKISRLGGAGGHRSPLGAIPVPDFNHRQWVRRRVVNRNLVGRRNTQPSQEPIITCYESRLVFALTDSANTPLTNREDCQQHSNSNSYPSNTVGEFEVTEETAA